MSTIYSEQLFSRNAAIFRPFLARAGLSENILEQPDIEVPIEAYIDLLEMVARESEPSIGLIMGETTQAGDLGDYGLAMAATPNAGECLRIMAQYLYVFAQMNTIRVDQASDWTVVSYRYHGPEPFGAIHDTEFAIVAILTILRGLTGQHIVPRYAEFAHRKPPYAREYARIFGCEVRFGQTGNRIHLDRRILDFPVLSADPVRLQALELSLADRLKFRSEETDLETRVIHLITANLREKGADIDTIASTLDISRRTLQRKLADAGLVFSDMVEAVRRAIAMEYVQYSDYSLTDIAMMLGYGELSSLSRAFRRWTGQSPHSLR